MTNFAMNMNYELESWLQNWIVKVFIKTASESRPMYILDTGSWSCGISLSTRNLLPATHINCDDELCYEYGL
jgi:hypothetical protein